MAQSDPTDHALAAIASILDQPESRREPEKAAAVEQRPVAPPPIPGAPERILLVAMIREWRLPEPMPTLWVKAVAWKCSTSATLLRNDLVCYGARVHG